MEWKGVQRRAQVRVDDFLPLSYRLISRKEYERVREEILSGKTLPSALGSVADLLEERGRPIDPNSPTFRALSILDKKLDHLLWELRRLAEPEEKKPSLSKVNISGSGIRFFAPERVSTGDLLLLNIELPLVPPSSLKCMAEVVHTRTPEEDEGLGPGQWLFMKFSAIHPTDQQNLTRYVFQRQRELLRIRRQEQEGKADPFFKG